MDTLEIHYVCVMVLHTISFVAAVILFIFIWCLIWDKLRYSGLELCFAILCGIIVLLFIYPGYIYKNNFIGSSLAIEFLQVLVIVFTIQVVGYLKLKASDYILLTVTLFLIYEYCYKQGFKNSMLFVGGWTVLCILIKRRGFSLNSKVVPAFLTFIAAQISYSIYSELFDVGIRRFYYSVSWHWGLTRWQKLIFLGLLTILFICIMGVILYAIKTFFKFYFYNINHLSEKYDEIGQYLLLIPFLFGFIIFLLEVYQLSELINLAWINRLIMILFIIIFLGMQLIYLKLLFRTIHLKEHLEYKESEQINLQEYNKDISRNLQEIREMKHDMKNVFLTMGEYVARSKDEDLKEYYYENIAPFAGNEIRRNDLYVNLQELQNESLKAFLYYKFLQGYDSNIDMQMDTELDHSIFPYLSDLSDIIRILGIFLDNAMEESLQVNQGFVRVNIKEKNGQMSVSVKNAVRDSVKLDGIHKGITSKGLGRGFGLSIVDKLVKKHDDILWNSYFQENVFVQIISTIKEYCLDGK